MTTPLYAPGDFVWCAFPQHENPARPGPEHVSLTLVATRAISVAGTPHTTLLLAYTSSRPWSGPVPPGVFQIDRAAASGMGQQRGFVIDARRLAFVPLTARWFPRLDQPGHGILGRAPKSLRRDVEEMAIRLLGRQTESVERLGPLWPKPGRAG